MNTPLQLRLCITANRITIEATGPLTALNAHHLTKAVVGALRRYQAPVLEIDLNGITDMDYVGEIALQDCAYETARRGMQLTITNSAAGNGTPRQKSNRPNGTKRRGSRARTLTHAGAICRYRINTR